jgi:serine/threonine protein phosphatase PrpC
MELVYYSLSDPGLVRTNNEDYLFAGQLKTGDHLFIVADGMGGHRAGEVASRKAVSLFVHHLEKENGFSGNEDSKPILEGLKRIVMDINETLIREGRSSLEKNGMGTTLSALYVRNDRGYLVHVGDSRIYLYSRPDSLGSEAAASPEDTRPEQPAPAVQLVQLTEDHSFVGRLLRDRLITREEARNHPKRNVLYQSIGLKREINIQARGAFPLKKGQKYLLCSDGLYGVVTDPEIEQSLKGKSTAQTAEQLVRQANANGGPDNISVIIVSTEPDKTAELNDTVKITALPLQKKKKPRVWFFILLVLLMMMLALIIYILLGNADMQVVPPIPNSESPGIVQPAGQAVSPGNG